MEKLQSVINEIKVENAFQHQRASMLAYRLASYNGGREAIDLVEAVIDLKSAIDKLELQLEAEQLESEE